MKHARHTDLTVEAAVSVPQVVEYLEQLVAALKSGAVHVRVGEQELVLGPRGVLGLKLHARQRGKRQKLALELTWRKKLISAEEGLGLEIRATPPETASEAIEVVDLGDADEVDRGDGAGEQAVADAAEKGEAHEGELATTSAVDEGTSA